LDKESKMNKDTLIYCSDLTALKTQLKADGYYDEESGSYTVNNTLTPLQYGDNTSLSYVRNNVLDMSKYPMLEDLGSYEQMEANPDARAKYLSVYDYETPVSYVDEEGNSQEYYKPKKIGSFA